MLGELYRNLDPWRKTLVARHPERPHCKDYVDALFREWTPLAGDRNFADDHAVMGGLARFNDRPVVVIGHEKGNDTRTRIARNFGMARPEGYRKAIRLMDLADRFSMPVITLVDTPGAYPGKGAEERGQAEAIARSTEKCLQIGVPVVSVVIGEGGSGGAVAFATADRIAMLEHSIYSVISPEGCASILWKDAEKMKEAAEALRLTAQDLLALGVIDRIVPEPRRRRPARQARGDRPRRRGDRRAPRRSRRQEAGRAAQGAAQEVPRHGAEVTGRVRRHREHDWATRTDPYIDECACASAISLPDLRQYSARWQARVHRPLDGRGPGSNPPSRISRSEAVLDRRPRAAP